MLTQDQAQKLIETLKVAAREKSFRWDVGQRYDELFFSINEKDLQFIISLRRNPFEIRLHMRTKRDNIGLLRVDGAPFHANPDGTELRDTPHLHVYREGYGLSWAEPIEWYSLNDPLKTLKHFLREANARFPSGFQLTLD